MRAELVKAESEVPRAMAEALRSGNLGVMDYYNLRNIQSDTDMRKSIGGGLKPSDDTSKKSSDPTQ